MICVAVFSLFPLLQGLVHAHEKFESGELKPPMYQSHPLDLLKERTEEIGLNLHKFALTVVVSDRGEVAGILTTARAREPRDPLYKLLVTPTNSYCYCYKEPV